MGATEQVQAPPERTIFEDGVMFRVIEETVPTNWITLASYASRVEAEAFLDGLGFTMAGRSKVTARTYARAAATVRAQQAAQDRHRRLHNERVAEGEEADRRRPAQMARKARVV